MRLYLLYFRILAIWEASSRHHIFISFLVTTTSYHAFVNAPFLTPLMVSEMVHGPNDPNDEESFKSNTNKALQISSLHLNRIESAVPFDGLKSRFLFNVFSS